MSDLVFSKYHDTEISKSDDFNFTAESPINILAAVIDGAFDDVVNSFVIAGMSVAQLASPSMNVAVKPGLAFSRADNKLLHLGSDLNVSVSPAHATLDRLDTLEVRFVTLDFDPETRAFKDPATGAITYAAVNTKTKAFIEGRCVAGTAGSGVAPNVESGWMKLAEVQVLAGSTTIINSNIRGLTAQEDGAQNSAWTAEKTAAFMLGSVESIKNTLLAHTANNITSANTVHGIRQGSGNGFDADTVDGIEGTRIIFGDTYGTTEITDANSPTKSGFYRLATPFTNGPGASSYLIIQIQLSGNSAYAVQMAYSSNTQGVAYLRSKLNGAWSAWAKLWNADNDGAGSGLDADLIDGKQSGNADGNIPINNGTVNANLNADLFDGKHLSALASPLDTGLVAYFSMDHVPEYPTGTATYFQDKFETADGWIGTLAMVTAPGGGVLQGVATSINFNVQKSSLSYPSATYTLRMKVRLSVRTGAATGYRLFMVSNNTNYFGTGVDLSDGNWKIIEATFAATGSTIQSFGITANNSAQIGDTILIDWAYFGDGSYADNSLLDISGNGRHGKIYGATPVEGISGKALSLDDTNDYTSVADALISVNSTYSVELWFKIYSLPAAGNWRVVWRKYVSVNDRVALLVNSSGQLLFAKYTGSYSAVYFATVALDTWYHVICVSQAGTLSLYVNGAVQSSTTTSASISSVRAGFFEHGIDATSNANVALNGVIDETRIINRALSADDAYGRYMTKRGADALPRAITAVPFSLPVRDANGAINSNGVPNPGFNADQVDGIEAERIVYGSGPRAATIVTDFTTITKSGFYYGLGSAVGAPTSDISWYCIHHQYPSADNYAFQLFIGVVDPIGPAYIKQLVNGTWRTAQKLWNAGNDGSGSGLDADMVDGIESARIVYGTDGYGSTAITDANAPTKAGFYRLETPYTNGPTAAAHLLIHNEGAAGTRKHQIAIATASNNSYIRNWNGSAWSAWVKLWNADNDGSGSGLDADLFDGIDSALFVYGMNNTASANVTSLDDIAKSGFYSFPVAASGSPDAAALGQLIHIQNALNAGVAVQVAICNATTQYYIRRKQSSAWQPWVKLWTAENDGAGSGLDADLLDGKQSGNADGNIPINNGTVNANLNADKVRGYSPLAVWSKHKSPNFVTVQNFTTPGSAIWTKPAGCKEVLIFAGGGGGGGGDGDSTRSGGGGGGGGLAIFYKEVSQIETLSFTVGAAGVGGGATQSGGAGGDTVIDGVTAGGGGGGLRGGVGSTGGAGGVVSGSPTVLELLVSSNGGNGGGRSAAYIGGGSGGSVCGVAGLADPSTMSAYGTFALGVEHDLGISYIGNTGRFIPKIISGRGGYSGSSGEAGQSGSGYWAGGGGGGANSDRGGDGLVGAVVFLEFY